MNQPLSQGISTTDFVNIEPRQLLVRAVSFVRAHAAVCCAGALLFVMALQMLVVIRRKSITVDEIVMIPSAYYHLASANFQLVNEHPPLSKLVAGVPLLFVQPEEIRPDQMTATPGSPDAKWAYYDSFWENNFDRFDSLSFWPRTAMIGLTIGLGILIFWFARELFGGRAAVIATALFALEPTLLAHGRVVQTDVPAAFGYLLFFVTLYRYNRRRNWRRAARARLCGSGGGDCYPGKVFNAAGRFGAGAVLCDALMARWAQRRSPVHCSWADSFRRDLVRRERGLFFHAPLSFGSRHAMDRRIVHLAPAPG